MKFEQAATKDDRRVYRDRVKPREIQYSNIQAAKAVSDAIRTSLGPKGMDKMIQASNGEVTITNDGATILMQMKLLHPAARMLVELSRNQDAEAGDGTTSVVVIAGSLLNSAEKLLRQGIHPSIVSDAFLAASNKAIEILQSMSLPIDLSDRESLIKIASTALNSKVVSQHSSLLAPIAVDSVLKIVEPGREQYIDLKNIKLIKKLGGTVEDTEVIDGLLIPHRVANVNGPKRVEKAKVAVIQFCISAPKPDMDHTIVLSDYTAMDRVLKEEREYILNIVKQIKKTGCNVLLVQKSILRDALSSLAIHFLDKIKVLVVKDVEREDIEFVCKTLNCRPIASLDHFVPESLATADYAEEYKVGDGKFVRICGIQNPGPTVNILVRGSNKLVLDEAERSLHDALCVIRCLVRQNAVIYGGGAPEIELSMKLMEYSNTITGAQSHCIRAYADAMEIVPYTLAENAGLNPISTVTQLRNRHANNDIYAGISVRKSEIANMVEDNVIQPLLVSTSEVLFATETVCSILKIDDVLTTIN